MDEVLEALDESIRKWQDVVYNGNYQKPTACPLCVLLAENDYFDEDLNDYVECLACPISTLTGSRHCKRTPFYETSVWLFEIGRRHLAQEPEALKANNEMLVFLHDVRHKYITGKIHVPN